MSNEEGPELTMPVAAGRDHILGREDAPVTLVEYGDFECPHCRRAHEQMGGLLETAGEMVRLVFRHFPLSQVHAHAERAAEGAEAAGAQGKFWEMYDLLFENQEALENEDLAGYAQRLGLDVAQFEKGLADRTYRQRVSEDFRAGIRSGVNGTPTFFINGRRHNGAWDAPSLMRAIMHAAKVKKPSTDD